jgi:hypothetical protein
MVNVISARNAANCYVLFYTYLIVGRCRPALRLGRFFKYSIARPTETTTVDYKSGLRQIKNSCKHSATIQKLHVYYYRKQTGKIE